MEYKINGACEEYEGDNTMHENDIDKLIEDITLNVFAVGTKKTNFKILQMLNKVDTSESDENGLKVDTISKVTKLSKVPVNKHINELEKNGLLRREKGTGYVYPTHMTGYFISLVDKVKEQVKINVSKMLPKYIS